MANVFHVLNGVPYPLHFFKSATEYVKALFYRLRSLLCISTTRLHRSRGLERNCLGISGLLGVFAIVSICYPLEDSVTLLG